MLQIHIHREMAVYEPRREASGETDPASALNLVFQPPEQRESECLLFKPPRVLWHPLGGGGYTILNGCYGNSVGRSS